MSAHQPTLSSPPVAAQGAGSLLPGATVASVSLENYPAGSSGSAGTFWRVPISDAALAIIEAGRERMGSKYSLAEIRREVALARPKRVRRNRKPHPSRLAQAAAGREKKAARRAEIVKALQARPRDVSIKCLAQSLKATPRTLRNIAKAEGISITWVLVKAPVVKRKRVYAPRAPRPSNNAPKQPEVALVSIPCICCERPFKSWDRKLNRMCGPCKESA